MLGQESQKAIMPRTLQCIYADSHRQRLQQGIEVSRIDTIERVGKNRSVHDVSAS